MSRGRAGLPVRIRGGALRTAALATAALLSGCGGPGGGPAATPTGGTGGGDAVTGQVTVLAAASLTDTFGALAGTFTDQHPQAEAVFSFGGSSGLAQQAVSGAPADVFAAASAATMATAVDGGAVDGEPVLFARNRLELVVPAGNPGGVRGLADLADPDLTVALCAPQVPCGAAAEKLLTAAGVTAAPDTLEQDVRAVLSKVSLGEVDAGLVYRTDVRSAGERVEGIEVPEAGEAVTDYLVAPLADAPNPDGARAFVDLVLSEQGRRVLSDAGFDGP